jgi:hypothetical protein
MFYVLFVCKCVLPPGVNPTAVDKYININKQQWYRQQYGQRFFLIFVKQQWYRQQYCQRFFLIFVKHKWNCQQYGQSCSRFFDKQQYYDQQYGQNCSLSLLSNNDIVNNVIKAYVKFNTNLLQSTFIC